MKQNTEPLMRERIIWIDLNRSQQLDRPPRIGFFFHGREVVNSFLVPWVYSNGFFKCVARRWAISVRPGTNNPEV